MQKHRRILKRKKLLKRTAKKVADSDTDMAISDEELRVVESEFEVESEDDRSSIIKVRDLSMLKLITLFTTMINSIRQVIESTIF